MQAQMLKSCVSICQNRQKEERQSNSSFTKEHEILFILKSAGKQSSWEVFSVHLGVLLGPLGLRLGDLTSWEVDKA